MATSDTNNYLELETETGDTIKVWRRAHPRARRLRLTVTSGGARVSYPEGTHPAQVFAFLRKHANWLERKLDDMVPRREFDAKFLALETEQRKGDIRLREIDLEILKLKQGLK